MNAIIQEPKKDQRAECWREDLELNTIEHRFICYNKNIMSIRMET